MVEATPHIGQRRIDCWWEPTFNPDLHGTLVLCDWEFDTSTGPQKSYLAANILEAHMPPGKVYKFNEKTFSDCDFQGAFEHTPSILFDRCRFHNCDFAFSSWHRATFRDCEFRDCSLALASFTECEFRACEWKRIGFAGHKTEIVRTFITNPAKLVNAGFSAPDPDRKYEPKHVSYQKSRLEGTKAHLARTLLQSHESVGDDKTYYETARLHDLQQTKARVMESQYSFRFGGTLRSRIVGLAVAFWLAELVLLWTIGFVNAWGASLLRPLLGLLLSFFVFGVVYRLTLAPPPSSHPWQMAFDIGSLAGYGNAVNPTQKVHLRLLESMQLVVSIFLYTIFLSTAVARFNRTR